MWYLISETSLFLQYYILMKKIDQENREVLITRYLAGEVSLDEIVELQKWLGASKDNLLYFQQLKNIWDNSEH